MPMMMNNRRYRDDEYRRAARRLHAEPEFDVPRHGGLYYVDGGAYVELLLWVPDAAVEVLRREDEINAQPCAQS